MSLRAWIQNLLTDDFEKLVVKPLVKDNFSDLPGKKNGPRDAAGHILRSALLYSEHPGVLNSDERVDFYLKGQEYAGASFGISGSDSAMDLHNDAIGRQIGVYAREYGLSREEIVGLVSKLVDQSARPAMVTMVGWEPQSEGTLVASTENALLAPGLNVPPIALMPHEQWHEGEGKPASLPEPETRETKLPPASVTIGDLGCLTPNTPGCAIKAEFFTER